MVVPDRHPRAGTAPTPSAGGPPWPARAGLAVRRDPDEGRPPAGDEGAQRLEVRARQVGAPSLDPALVTEPVDRALLGAAGRRSSPRPPTAFEAYDYTTALEVTEQFFWEFCDDYLELVKERAYGGRGDAAAALGAGRAGARAAGPAAAARAVPALRDRGGLVVVAGGLGPPGRVAGRGPTLARGRGADPADARRRRRRRWPAIRGAKSEAKVSMRTEVSPATVTGPQDALDRVRPGRRRPAGRRPGRPT